MLNRHWGTKVGISRIVDTYVLSQLYNPSYTGGHSLEAWGSRLGHEKTEHEDFSCLTQEMLEYCANDTALTAILFRRLTQRMRQYSFTECGAEIEHLAWNVIQNKQRKNGFPFDEKRALELFTTLRKREEELRKEIHELWPPQLLAIGEYQRPYKKDGSRSANLSRHLEQYPKVEISADGTSYTAYDWVEFNLGSPKQRVDKLLELGWQPTQFTKRTVKGGGGNPKVDEDSLTAFAESSGRNEIRSLAKWIVVNSRANNMVATWLDAYRPETKAIHGRLFIASTLRYRHAHPNSANIPAVRTKKGENDEDQILYGEDGFWTYEARDLWTCGNPDTHSLVGIDGTGIQNRCLIHHLIATVGEDAVSEFKELALRGDIHKHNIRVLGLANKAAAKKFYYTLMMGGQGKRLAADQAQFGTKMTPEEGTRLRDQMIASMPGFSELTRRLEEQLRQTGRITLCDGTPILVSSPHMVIPYLLQGDESRLMKKAMILVDQEVRKAGLQNDILKVADIHDEWQYTVRNEYVDTFIGLALPCFPRAGESFSYNILIEGDAKVGKTWAETH
jgi:DNA polymerase-1